MESVKYLEFSKKGDIRGALIPVEAYKDVPFKVQRLFFIKDLDEYPRGYHAHKITEQVILPICGSFKIKLTDGIISNVYNLDKDNIGLYIPIGIWLEMFDFSSNVVICVICSYKYDENEYIRNYGDFIKYREHMEEIKCFNLSKHNATIMPQISQAVDNILDSNAFVLGQELKVFETRFAEYTGSQYCVACSNGTSAIVCAIKALNLPLNSEIIVQANTYIAAPLAIEIAGYKIKIVDIDNSLNMNLTALEESINYNTRAVIVVHLYGACPDMDKLLDIQNKYGFYLIEDCAQAHGSRFKGKHLGTFGQVGCFSFYPSKNLGSIGEGGCIITDNLNVYNFARKYRNYGSEKTYQWEIKGTNDRMHNIQAAVLNVKLDYLEDWNYKRRVLAGEYDRLLSEISHVVTIPNKHKHLISSYHLYVILVPDRMALQSYLANKSIQTSIHYPETFYNSPAFSELSGAHFLADITKHQVLSLPMYPELEIESVRYICNTIKEYYIEYL